MPPEIPSDREFLKRLRAMGKTAKEEIASPSKVNLSDVPGNPITKGLPLVPKEEPYGATIEGDQFHLTRYKPHEPTVGEEPRVKSIGRLFRQVGEGGRTIAQNLLELSKGMGESEALRQDDKEDEGFLPYLKEEYLGDFKQGTSLLSKLKGAERFTPAKLGPKVFKDVVTRVIDKIHPPAWEKLSKKSREALETDIMTTPEAYKESLGFFEDAANMAPQLLTLLGTTYLFKTPVAGSLFIGTQIAGGQYGELSRQGVDPRRAIDLSVLNATLQTIPEVLSAKIAIKGFKQVAERTDIANRLINLTKTLAIAPPVEFFTEWVQKYPEEITNIAALNPDKGTLERTKLLFDNLGRVNREGAYEGLVAAFMTSFVPFAGLVRTGKSHTMSEKEANNLSAQAKILRIGGDNIDIDPEVGSRILEIGNIVDEAIDRVGKGKSVVFNKRDVNRISELQGEVRELTESFEADEAVRATEEEVVVEPEAEVPPVVEEDVTVEPEVEAIPPVEGGVAEPPVAESEVVPQQTYDEVQAEIDDTIDALMEDGLSFEEADSHPSVEQLYETRNKIGQKELEQSYNEISPIINKTTGDQKQTDSILSRIYSLDPKDLTGQYFASEYTVEQVDNREETRGKILRKIVEDYGREHNLDMDGVFSGASGFTAKGQRNLLKKLTDKANKIEEDVYGYFHEDIDVVQEVQQVEEQPLIEEEKKTDGVSVRKLPIAKPPIKHVARKDKEIVDTEKFYVLNEKTGKFKKVEVKTRKQIPGFETFDLFIHKTGDVWAIAEGLTGKEYATGTTQKEAMESFLEKTTPAKLTADLKRITKTGKKVPVTGKPIPDTKLSPRYTKDKKETPPKKKETPPKKLEDKVSDTQKKLEELRALSDTLPENSEAKAEVDRQIENEILKIGKEEQKPAPKRKSDKKKPPKKIVTRKKTTKPKTQPKKKKLVPPFFKETEEANASTHAAAWVKNLSTKDFNAFTDTYQEGLIRISEDKEGLSREEIVKEIEFMQQHGLWGEAIKTRGGEEYLLVVSDSADELNRKREGLPPGPETNKELVDRRVNLGDRKIVEDLLEKGSKKGLSKAETKKLQTHIFHDTLTGIPSHRGWEAKKRLLHQAFLDGDGTKWLNDNVGYDEGGDVLLVAMGNAIKNATKFGSRFHGDEFQYEAYSRTELKEVAEKIHQYMKDNPLKITMPNGEVRYYEGKVTIGLGRTEAEAERSMKTQKKLKKEDSELSGRGDELTRVYPEGDKVKEGKEKKVTDDLEGKVDTVKKLLKDEGGEINIDPKALFDGLVDVGKIVINKGAKTLKSFSRAMRNLFDGKTWNRIKSLVPKVFKRSSLEFTETDGFNQPDYKQTVEGIDRAEGNIPHEKPIAKVIEGTKNFFVGFTKQWVTLPEKAEFAKAKSELLKQAGLPEYGWIRGKNTTDNIFGKIDRETAIKVRNVMIIKDLNESIEKMGERGEDISEKKFPFNLTRDRIVTLNEWADETLENNLEVKTVADKAWAETLRLNGELVKAYAALDPSLGKWIGNRVTRQHYFPHMILKHTPSIPGIRGAQGLKIQQYRTQLKTRFGSAEDYNTNIPEVMLVSWGQVEADIEIAKSLSRMEKEYNVTEELRAGLNELKLSVKKGLTWRSGFLSESPFFGQEIDTPSELMAELWAIGKKRGKLIDSGEIKDSDWVRFENETKIILRSLRDKIGLYRNALSDPTFYQQEEQRLAEWYEEKQEGKLSEEDQTAMEEYGVDIREVLGDQWNEPTLGYMSQSVSEFQAALLQGDVNATGQWFREKMFPGYETVNVRDMMYYAHTVADDLVKEILDGLSVNIEGVDLNKVLVRSDPIAWVIPKEIADTVEHIKREKLKAGLQGPIETLAIEMTKFVRGYFLYAPENFPRYIINNTVADSTFMLGIVPSAVKKKYVTLASKMLSALSNPNKLEGLTGKQKTLLREFFVRGGRSAGFTNFEFGVRVPRPKWKGFKTKKKSVVELPVSGVSTYMNGVHAANTWTEVNRRLVGFLAAYDMLTSETKKKSHWVSRAEFIDAQPTNYDKAYHLANDLMISYDKTSETGRKLGKLSLIFYSFREGNVRRFFHMFRNAKIDSTEAQAIAKMALGPSVKVGTQTATTIGINFFRLAGLQVAAFLWNTLVFPDAERELANDVRSRIHFIYHHNKETGVTRFYDTYDSLHEIFRLIGLAHLGNKVDGGWKNIVRDIALSPINEAYGLLNPFIKIGLEEILGMSLWPEVQDPRYIKDRIEYFMRMWKKDVEYAWLTDKPDRGFLKEKVRRILFKEIDLGEVAYFKTLKTQGDFLDTKGVPHLRFGSTKGSKALYYWKKAIVLNDKKAIEKYSREYIKWSVENNMEPKDVVDIAKSLSPMNVVSTKYLDEFHSQLTSSESRTINTAMKYYQSLFMTDNFMERLDRSKREAARYFMGSLEDDTEIDIRELRDYLDVWVSPQSEGTE